MRKIILASNSPRRRELMKLLGVPFDVVASNYDEEKEAFASPKEMVESLSLSKAKVIAETYKDAVVIGADTTVVLGNEIIGKPKDKKDALAMLKKLSGTVHSVMTGYTVLDATTGKHVTGSVLSTVELVPLSDEEIIAYLDIAEYADKAGGYAVQEVGGVFVKETHGDFFNIVGLPIKDIRRELRNLGIPILE